jgi:glycosyltransferase involved in cell wall biosynthesis
MAPRTQARAHPRLADERLPPSDETLAFPRWRRPMRILITTDAWAPQVNGVVRTLETLGKELVRLGHDVRFVTPDGFRTIPMPTYPEIKLALFARRAVGRVIDTFKPDAIHIATEGPLGLATRRNCMRRGISFTTSFHTRFPEYIHARFGVPTAWPYAGLRWFHGPATAVMVATRTLERDLTARGFKNLRPWSRGVDTDLFKPAAKDWLDLPRPVFLYVGRVAIEKSVEEFLKLDLPGSKLIVGDGPQLAELRARYPQAHFAGPKFGAELARYYGASDVFVFPSRTDTFGLVVLEALASGLPVAAHPVQGPIDIIGGNETVGALDEDLQRAALRALQISPQACRSFAMNFSWEACTRQFLMNLATPDERQSAR